MDGAPTVIAAAEYQIWTPPKVALSDLELVGRLNAIEALKSQMRSGAMRLCALETRTIQSGGAFKETAYLIIHLQEEVDRLENVFWAVGEHTIWSRPSRMHESSRPVIYLHGLRFDPVRIAIISNQFGVARIAPSASTFALSVTNNPPLYRAKPRLNKIANEPKVSRMELRNWLASWEPKDRDATFPEIMSAATSAFPNRRITRQPLRDAIGELGMTKNRGNPTIRRK